MSGPVVAPVCALSNDANIGPPASAVEAFRNERREMVGGVMVGGCWLLLFRWRNAFRVGANQMLAAPHEDFVSDQNLITTLLRIHFHTTMTTNHNEDAARRAYWAEQMELGSAMVQQLIAFPVSECGECFASIPEAAAAMLRTRGQ